MMRSIALAASISVLSLFFFMGAAAEGRAGDWVVRGRVVDQAGRPVADAAVASFWRANGSGKDATGKLLDLSKEENVKRFWSDLGAMEPSVAGDPVKTRSDGQFSLTTPDVYHTVMAMDRSRRRGGLVVLPKGKESEPVEIRIGPLVRVRASFEGPGANQRPHWTHVYVHVPNDPSRPIDSPRLVSCGSFDARFEAWLPPGSYVLGAYSEFADKELFEGELIPDRTITLSSDARDVDLGLLKFAPHRTQNRTRIAQAKEHGRWNDYTKHYGEKPPRWHITDARGVARDVQLADFAGKWVLVEFWGFGCRPCLKTGLPRLMKFYEDHKRDRDRFEILAVCIDPDDELKSMADVDRRLEPIIKNVWGGNRLPFPVLLDQTFQTWERFGLSGMGEILLVDPQGRLVKGDDSVLARKLEERQEKP